MSSHSFATLTKALGLRKSRKQSRPPMLRTSLSHSSLFSPTADHLSGSPRSAPPTQTSLRHSKSTSNFPAVIRTWSRTRRQWGQAADRIFSVPTTPSPKTRTKFTLERRSTSSSSFTSSNPTTVYTPYTTAPTAYDTFPHSPTPAQIWPCFVWDPSADAEELDLDLDAEDDQPVFAEFFQRLRDIEAELDLIEARGGFQN